MKTYTKNHKKRDIAVLFGIFIFSIGFAQIKTDTLFLTLNQAIEIAQLKSPQALQAKTTKETSYWKWRSFKSNYLPQLAIRGTLPNFTKNTIAVTQPDGTTDYRLVQQSNSNLGLSLSQAISLTGATVSINSTLSRFDNLVTDFRNYNSNAVNINIKQPLFGFNRYLWEKKIEPLRFEESQKKFIEEREMISYETTAKYFSLLLAQNDYKIAIGNLKNNELLYEIAKTRYDLGKITKNELLKRKLSVIEDKKQISLSNARKKRATRAFLVYMGPTLLKTNQPLQLRAPSNIPHVAVAQKTALAEALKNRSAIVTYKRRILEANRTLARAKADNGFKADVSLTFGLTNSDTHFSDLYARSDNSQGVLIGFSMPIADWGRSKSRLKTAQLEKDLQKQSVNLAMDDFEREIISEVEQFEMHKEQTIISLESSDIASMSYEISKNKFILGKETTTDLNIALTQKDSAIRSYIASLQSFWLAYYRIRLLTVYDFEKNTSLINIK